MSDITKKITIYTLSLMLVAWSAAPGLAFAEESDTGTGAEQSVLTEEITEQIGEQIIEQLTAEVPPEDEEQELALVEADTGDATGLVNVENHVNINETELADGDKEAEEITDETEDEIQTISEEDTICTESSCRRQPEHETAHLTDVDITNVINTNQADVENGVTGEANTGRNSIIDNITHVDLSTGEIQLISNIFNLINFNITGADYISAAYSLVGGIIGDLDLSRYNLEELAQVVEDDEVFQELELEATCLEEETCEAAGTKTVEIDVDEETTVTNTNEADVNNEVVLDATSGLNEVIGNSGKVKMVTGNITVASNLVNIVNTNIIGNGWTLAIINIVGGWVGDLVLPSLTNFLAKQDKDFSVECIDYECLSELADGKIQSVEQSEQTVVANNNDATVVTDVEILANSGGNEVVGNEGDVAIETGAVVSQSQVYNQVNTNIYKSGWVYGLVNVMGNWLGGFYGQPEEGFEVTQTGGGWQFSYDPNAFVSGQSTVSELEENEDSEVAYELDIDRELTINNTNQANVTNTVKILADSGSNVIADNGGDVSLKTGDVSALSNIMNMVNSNVVGDDWTLAIVNIVGDWDGNITFGKPDLIVNEMAQPDPEPAVPSGYIDYYITVTNVGDAPAVGVDIRTEVEEDKVIVNDTEGGSYENGQVIWNVDEIGIGEIIVKHYRAQVRQQVNAGDDVNNHTEAWSEAGDRNPDDNIAFTQIFIHQNGVQMGWGYPTITSLGKNSDGSIYDNPVYNNSLQIKKYSDAAGLVYREQTVNYTIELTNNSDESLYDVIVFDDMRGPNGALINSQDWELGEVLPHEHISISYSVNISDQAPAGEYVNYASADGFDSQNRYSLFPETSSSITVSDFAPETAGEYIDIEYQYQQNKYVGETSEESVIITNLGSTTIPAGQLILTYDGSYLVVDGDVSGGLAFIVPELAPLANYTVQFQVAGLLPTSGTLLGISYLAIGRQVAGVTADYHITDEVPVDATVAPTNDQLNVMQINEQSDLEGGDQIERKTRVLGYMENFGNDITTPPLNASNYFWSSMYDNLSSWWFWFELLIVLFLVEAYRRYRRGERFWERTFGFRIF